MAVIDVGSGVGNRASYNTASFTNIDKGNPANETGVLDSFSVWMTTTGANSRVGVFTNTSSNNLTSGDYEDIGTITSGSEQTFTGLTIDVSSGQYLGLYSAGKLEVSASGGSGLWYKQYDQFTGSSVEFSLGASWLTALYATGATVAAGNPYYYYLQQ